MWEIFWFLDGGRQGGFSGPQPLSLTDIKIAIVDVFQVPDSARRNAFILVRFADTVYMGHYAKQNRKLEKKWQQKRSRSR